MQQNRPSPSTARSPIPCLPRPPPPKIPSNEPLTQGHFRRYVLAYLAALIMLSAASILIVLAIWLTRIQHCTTQFCIALQRMAPARAPPIYAPNSHNFLEFYSACSPAPAHWGQESRGIGSEVVGKDLRESNPVWFHFFESQAEEYDGGHELPGILKGGCDFKLESVRGLN
jgi:hypothetical protein